VEKKINLGRELSEEEAMKYLISINNEKADKRLWQK
jgi:hypothetical protein